MLPQNTNQIQPTTNRYLLPLRQIKLPQQKGEETGMMMIGWIVKVEMMRIY